ncbi:MAG: nucleotidyl transferase AbiEii/AbiGii toxin family protein [Patescibacteria group bacterium]|nr:nucleotidyl transferase AbiEii/AbiGii toxin family protein [Patescibacteria group bacterium]
MKLDKDEHRRIMLKILEEISSDPLLANNLGFKGGTACYFLYGLDRFSVDLDFDFLNEKKDKKTKERLLKMLNKYGSVKTKTSIKVIYSNEYQALKIDISDRHKNNKFNTYKVKDIVSGLPLKVLQKEDIFAHKLVALIDRSASGGGNEKFIANRDLYDIHFFFKNGWKFNKEIIEQQTGKKVQKYLQEVKNFIEKYTNESNILDRLGELVNENKRIWVKKNLKKEVLKRLAMEIKVLEQ